MIPHWTIVDICRYLYVYIYIEICIYIYRDIYIYIEIDVDIDIHIIAKASFEAKCELSITETLRLRLMPNLIALRLDVAGTPHEILLRSPKTCGGNEMATTSMEISWILKTWSHEPCKCVKIKWKRANKEIWRNSCEGPVVLIPLIHTKNASEEWMHVLWAVLQFFESCFQSSASFMTCVSTLAPKCPWKSARFITKAVFPDVSSQPSNIWPPRKRWEEHPWRASWAFWRWACEAGLGPKSTLRLRRFF